MNKEILDLPEDDKQKKNYFQRLKEGSPIIIMLIVVLYSLFTFATTDHVFTLTKIIGITGVFIAALAYFAFDKLSGIWIFMVVLFLGIIELIKFTPSHITYTIFGLTFSPLSTFLFIFNIYWYRRELRIGLEKLKKISFIKKVVEYWNSLPES